MLRRGSVLPLLSFLVIAGCASEDHAAPREATAPPAATRGGGEMRAGQDMCPMHVAGTQVNVSDTENGVAIAFTTNGDVEELRARVRRVAEMHEQRMAGGHMGTHDGGMHHGGMHHGDMHMVPSHAEAQDVAGGARLVLTPVDPADLEALRANARRHAGMMASGQCPMMTTGGAQPPAETHHQR